MIDVWTKKVTILLIFLHNECVAMMDYIIVSMRSLRSSFFLMVNLCWKSISWENLILEENLRFQIEIET
jgi:hypothetical protein